MHKRILEDITLEQLKKFVDSSLSELKTKDKEMYEDLELELYLQIYGYHFSDWKLKCALDSMENEDGSTGGHWTVEDTTRLAQSNNIEFYKFNKYDWNYVVNMMYSDYYGSVPNDISSYINLAKKFLLDKDAPEGKAFKYYLAMHH